MLTVVVVQLLSHVWLCSSMDFSMPGSSVLHCFPEFAQIHVHSGSDAIWTSHPLPDPFSFAFSLFPHQVFSNESALWIKWPRYWSFKFTLSPSNEYSGLISFKIDWVALFAVPGSLMSLFHHDNSKASILWHSAFFMVQLSYTYMTTGKIVALTILTFVGKVMSLLFNMLSSCVITFLLRSKHLLISWLQSSSAVILEPKKIKYVSASTFPFYFPWSDGARYHDS